MTSQSSVDDGVDAEKIKAMEDIIRHYTGLATFDKPFIVNFARSLESSGTALGRQQSRDLTSEGAESVEGGEEFRIDPVSSTTTGKPVTQNSSSLLDLPVLTYEVYTGELSHCDFSDNVHRKLNEGLKGSYSEVS